MRGGRKGFGWILLAVVGVVSVLGQNVARPPTSTLPTSAPAQTLIVTPRIETPSAKPDDSRPDPITTKTLYVKADTLNVRSSPSTDSPVLLRLSRGSAVLLQHRSGDWYGVQLTNGATGWLHGGYLTETPPSDPVDLVAATPDAAAKPAYNRDEVVQAIIRTSLSTYPGRCPCPYNTMRNGRSCGGNSAYSKPGGRAPLCYPSDVTERMIAEYVSRH